MFNRPLFLVAVLVTAAPACSDEEPAKDEATFEAVVKNVLEPRCTFASCHANPTVAAALDLTAEQACNTLLDTPSCLFPDRMRIVPGRPDESFFFHKLTGQGLNETPTGSCAQSNLIMPFGGTALPDDELALVHDWIAAGASCDRNPDMTPPGGEVPVIAGLSASRTAPIAGETIMITVMLDKAAPKEGQLIEIESDSGSLSAPVQVVVPSEAAVARFEVYALRPTSRFTLRATSGKSSKQLILRIAGLDIAEVMTDPIGVDDGRQWIKLYNRTPLPIDLSGYELKAGMSNYDLVKVQLTGSLPAGSCALVGGPKQSSPSDPPFTLPINFAPDLPHVSAGTTGFALFDRFTAAIDAIPTPVDTMIIGSNNAPGLLGPDAEIPEPYCMTPSTSLTALRTGAGTCVAATPQPSACP
jgi:hypothetical protein